MSGHSKWATTKHKKAVIDAKRAKSFAKLIKNIEVAARAGGADMAGNPGLELAVQKAKKTSVPISCFITFHNSFILGGVTNFDVCISPQFPISIP